ncbi:MAG: hypothetical protein QM756_03620 [Polyangiaceae bacterium]
MNKRFLSLLPLCVVWFAQVGCGSDDDGSPSGSGGKAVSSGGATSTGSGGKAAASGGTTTAASGGSSSAACPSLAGSWTVNKHCQASYVGTTVMVNQTGCTATVPAYGFSGTVGANGELNFSGTGATCTGAATGNTITEQCTVLGTPCTVVLTR